MTEEKWSETIEQIESRFGILEQKKEEFAPEAGGGFKEAIFFESPLGKVRLEFTKRPKVLEKKIYSHRKKTGALMERVFSEGEFVCFLKAFRFNPETMEWQAIEGERLADNI